MGSRVPTNMRRRGVLIVVGPAVAAVFFAALSPAAALGGLHSLRAAAYVTLTMVVSLGLALMASRRSKHAWLTVAAGLLPAAIALGAITIPTLHQRELNEEFPVAIAADVTTSAPVPDADVAPSNTAPSNTAPVANVAPVADPAIGAPPPSPTPTATAVRLVSGELKGIDHDASGTITVYRTGNTLLLRFENVDIQRVPDAQIYLEPRRDAQSTSNKGLSLGASKAEKGTFSYELPSDYSLPREVTLLVWCRAFDTPVANATLL